MEMSQIIPNLDDVATVPRVSTETTRRKARGADLLVRGLRVWRFPREALMTPVPVELPWAPR
jgi:hypothetical protein